MMHHPFWTAAMHRRFAEAATQPEDVNPQRTDHRPSHAGWPKIADFHAVRQASPQRSSNRAATQPEDVNPQRADHTASHTGRAKSAVFHAVRQASPQRSSSRAAKRRCIAALQNAEKLALMRLMTNPD